MGLPKRLVRLPTTLNTSVDVQPERLPNSLFISTLIRSAGSRVHCDTSCVIWGGLFFGTRSRLFGGASQLFWGTNREIEMWSLVIHSSLSPHAHTPLIFSKARPSEFPTRRVDLPTIRQDRLFSFGHFSISSLHPYHGSAPGCQA